MITVTVKLFAIYQEVFGKTEITYQLPVGTPVAAVLERMIAEHPQLAQWQAVTKFAIDLEFVDGDAIVADGSEVVLIPPVSGG
jgi:sulfur-carrier protein